MSKWDNNARMTDLRGPDAVEVQIDKTDPTAWKLWVNVDGACRLRIYDINPQTFTTDTYDVEDSHG